MRQRYNSVVPLEPSSFPVDDLGGWQSTIIGVVSLSGNVWTIDNPATATGKTCIAVEVPLVGEHVLSFDLIAAAPLLWISDTQVIDIAVGNTINLHSITGCLVSPHVSYVNAQYDGFRGTYTTKAYTPPEAGIPAGIGKYVFITAIIETNDGIGGYVRANVKELKSLQPLK